MPVQLGTHGTKHGAEGWPPQSLRGARTHHTRTPPRPHSTRLIPGACYPGHKSPTGGGLSPWGPVVPKATLRYSEHTSLQARLQSTLQKCASLLVSLQVITETATSVPPAVPPPHTSRRTPLGRPPSRTTFIFCAFLFFTRPGRFFNLAPELLLFVDNLDGAFFLPDVFFRLPAKSTLTALASLSAPPCCPPKARPTNHCPPRLGALLPYFLLRGVYTLPHGGPGGSTQRGQGKSEPMLISRPDH